MIATVYNRLRLAWLERQSAAYRARVLRASRWWFIVFVLVAGCAHRRTLREIETVRADCYQRIQRAEPDQRLSILAACEEAITEAAR